MSTKSNDHKNKLFKQLLETYIKNEVTNMLRYIHYKYPKQFTKKTLKMFLKKHIYNNKLVYYNYTKNRKIRIYRTVKKKIFIRKFKNLNIGGLKDKKQNSTLIFNSNKCHARVWNNGSIIKMENNTIVYGKQCHRKKNPNSTYCYQHSKKNPHDEFNKIPTQELIDHYKRYQVN